MIGLRAGEALAAYRARRSQDQQRVNEDQMLRHGYGTSGEIDGEGVLHPNAVAASHGTLPRRCQTPDDRPIRVPKIRKQRGSHDSSIDEENETPGPSHRGLTDASRTPKPRLRGPSFARFNLRKKISGQELVASVKETYHSRPSLNLSRSRVNDYVENHPVRSFDEHQLPLLQRWRSNTTGSKPNLQPERCSIEGVELSSSSLFERSVMRRLSAGHKRTLRQKRRSLSANDTASSAPSSRASITVTTSAEPYRLHAQTTAVPGSSVTFQKEIMGMGHKSKPLPLSPKPHTSSRQPAMSTRRMATPWPDGAPSTKITDSVALDISFMCDVPEVDVASKRRVWIALRLHYMIPLDVFRSTINAPVGIIILIDNASNIPGSAIAKSCEAVLAIAQHLNRSIDQLAVFATTCCHNDEISGSITGCQLHPLRKPSARILQEELVNLMNHSAPNGAASIGGQLRSSDGLVGALNAVIGLILEDQSSGHERSKYHFIVLSPKKLSSALHYNFKVPVHEVDPTWIDMFEPPTRNGPRQHRLGCVEPWAKDFVANARAGSEMDLMHEIKLDLQSGSHTKLVNVVGEKDCAWLAPGQELDLLTEVEVAQIDPGRLSTSWLELETIVPTLTVDEAFAELSYLLGEISHPVLQVAISYKTAIDRGPEVIHGQYDVNRRNAASVWSLGSSVTADSDSVGMNRRDAAGHIPICTTLIAQLVRTSRAAEALNIVESLASKTDLPTHARDLCEVWRTRLIQQLRTETPEPGRTQPSNGAESPQLDRFSFEPPNITLSPLHKVATASTETVSTIRYSPSPLPPKHSDDKARDIWRLMRRDSKTRKQLERAAASEELHDLERRSGEVREIRRRAVMNKRSVGADTLRSLALSPAMSSDGVLEAPWM